MKRIFAVAIVTLCLATALFALGDKDLKAAPPAATVIRVGALKGPTGIGMIYLFEGETALPGNASLALEGVPSADAMAAKLLSGAFDAAVLPVNMAAKLYNAGLPYRLAAVVGNGMVKILTTDPSLASLADLRGREIYVAGQGATPEFLMRTILPKSGINPDTDLHLGFNLPYPEIAASLVAGTIDIAVLPEPFATLALRGNPAVRVPFSLSALWTEATGQSDYPMSVFVIRSSLLEEHPAAVRALLADYKASIARVVADPAAAGVLVEKHDMGLKAPIAAAAIPEAAFTFVPAVEARASVEALLSIFLAAAPASIGSRLPDGEWYASPQR